MKSGEGSPWQPAARASMGRSSLSPILMCLGRWEGSSQVPKLLSSDSGLPGAGFIARRHFHHYTILVAAYAVLYSDSILGPAPGYPTLLIRPEKLLIAHRLYTASPDYSFRWYPFEQDWKAVQRCATKTDHVPIWINTKYMYNIQYWTYSTEYQKIIQCSTIWQLETKQIWNFRQTNFATWDKYIWKFGRNEFCHFEQIHFAVWEKYRVLKYIRQYKTYLST